jgi:hypothetical protein
MHWTVGGRTRSASLDVETKNAADPAFCDGRGIVRHRDVDRGGAADPDQGPFVTFGGERGARLGPGSALTGIAAVEIVLDLVIYVFWIRRMPDVPAGGSFGVAAPGLVAACFGFGGLITSIIRTCRRVTVPGALVVVAALVVTCFTFVCFFAIATGFALSVP